MTATEIASLKALHRHLGNLFCMGRLLTVTVMVMGSLFCLLSLFLFRAVQHPEALLNAQGFMLNYAELHPLESASVKQTGRPEDSGIRHSQPTDPNWDGALAGASLGFNLGQSVPLFGAVGAPLLAAIISYELDTKI